MIRELHEWVERWRTLVGGEDAQAAAQRWVGALQRFHTAYTDEVDGRVVVLVDVASAQDQDVEAAKERFLLSPPVQRFIVWLKERGLTWRWATSWEGVVSFEATVGASA